MVVPQPQILSPFNTCHVCQGPQKTVDWADYVYNNALEIQREFYNTWKSLSTILVCLAYVVGRMHIWTCVHRLHQCSDVCVCIEAEVPVERFPRSLSTLFFEAGSLN